LPIRGNSTARKAHQDFHGPVSSAAPCPTGTKCTCERCLNEGAVRLQSYYLCQANWPWAHIVFVIFRGAFNILPACNTVEGAGKDVSRAGHDVSEEANEYK